MEFRSTAEKVARELRATGLQVITPLSVDGFGAQLKLASKHGARYAVLFGESELAQGQALLKDMTSGQQVTVALGEIASQIASKASH
jgi:histidyl-tRNA synthetase